MEVAQNRSKFFEQEVDRNSGLSESLLKKVAGVNNYILCNYFERYDIMLNGNYGLAAGSVGVDGIRAFIQDVEIKFITFWAVGTGTSGQLELDIIRLSDSGVNAGSIFNTTPKIDSTADDFTYVIYDVEAGQVVKGLPVGVTAPDLNTSAFSCGEAITAELVSGAAGGCDAGMIVYYIPVTN